MMHLGQLLGDPLEHLIVKPLAADEVPPESVS